MDTIQRSMVYNLRKKDNKMIKIIIVTILTLIFVGCKYNVYEGRRPDDTTRNIQSSPCAKYNTFQDVEYKGHIYIIYKYRISTGGGMHGDAVSFCHAEHCSCMTTNK